jgi:hypothetical protein
VLEHPPKLLRLRPEIESILEVVSFRTTWRCWEQFDDSITTFRKLFAAAMLGLAEMLERMLCQKKCNFIKGSWLHRSVCVCECVRGRVCRT